MLPALFSYCRYQLFQTAISGFQQLLLKLEKREDVQGFGIDISDWAVEQATAKLGPGRVWAADLEYSYSLQNLRFTNLSPDVQRLSVNNYIHHIDYNVAYMPLPRDRRFRRRLTTEN